MDDNEVLGRINELAREEHELFASRWTSAGTCSARDGRGGRRGSTRTKHGPDHGAPAESSTGRRASKERGHSSLGRVRCSPIGGRILEAYPGILTVLR